MHLLYFSILIHILNYYLVLAYTAAIFGKVVISAV